MGLQLTPTTEDETEQGSTGQGYSLFSSPYDWYTVRRRRIWRPPTDVYETDQEIVVKVEIAGMRQEDFQIGFNDHTLTIAGQRRDPVGKLVYQNMEISYGDFRTDVRINWPLEQSEIEATYEQGFLFVKLPKARQRRVPIRVQE
jgi:HSP20 family protein